MAKTAKLFWSGRSQAVRLPKEFRMDGKEVRIRKQGASVVLEPVVSDWAWLDAIEGSSQKISSPKGANSRRIRTGLPSMPPLSDVWSPACAICSTQTLALRY